MRIAILTDMHAFAGGSDSPSWLNLAEDRSNPKTNPFAGLNDLLADGSISAELIICGGDLGDKASPEGQQYVWSEVNKLKTPLNAAKVIATAGNHDMDSRMVNTKFDAKGQLQALDPPFPVDDRNAWMEYWAKNYTIIEHDQVRIAIVNSSAYHGYHARDNDPEYYHGRISDRTLENLSQDLKQGSKRAANILLCHHHPMKNDQISIQDYSEMKNGDRLLNTLVDIKVGPWLVIHGHKHLPRVIQAPGGNTAPIVFSAGSFSARPYPEYGDKARNEFYILELEVPVMGSTSTLKGQISTWQWSYGIGWQRPRVGSGLGPRAAFGARVDLAGEANSLAASLKQSQPGQSIAWDEIIVSNTNLRYLLPEDLSAFLEHLNEDHGFRLLHEANGEISQVQVPSP